jgi:hypothetical protein
MDGHRARVGLLPRERPPLRRWLTVAPDRLCITRPLDRRGTPLTISAEAISQIELERGIRGGSVLVRDLDGSSSTMLLTSSYRQVGRLLRAGGWDESTSSAWPGRSLFVQRAHRPNWELLT